MSSNRNDVVRLNRIAVKRIMDIQGHSNYTLAVAMKCDATQIRRWLDEKGTGVITKARAQDMANALCCSVSHLTGQEPFTKFDLNPPDPLIGTPAYYARAMNGKWWAISHVAAGKSQEGNEIPAAIFEWEVELFAYGDTLSGTCVCRTEGWEHGQYKLEGRVNGRGFCMFDGVRGIPDGAEDMLRVLLQFHSDARTKWMDGGFVMYWAEFQQIFEGHFTTKPMDKKQDEIQSRKDKQAELLRISNPIPYR